MRTGMVLIALLVPASISAQPLGSSDPALNGGDKGHHETTQQRALAHRFRLPIMVTEGAFVTLPPLYYYWRTIDDQKEDWELQWTWHDWKEKLTSADTLVLDTNRFTPNALRHPLTGALMYQIGRANGLGPFGSTLIDFGHGLAWEYLAEYRERPSINDIFSNTIAGVLIGEPLYQLGRLADRRPTVARRGLSLIASPFHRTQRELYLSPLDDAPEHPNRLEAILGTSAARQASGSVDSEMRVGLDLEMVLDPEFGLSGERTRRVGLGDWDRVALDLRADNTGLTGGRFRSYTTFWGREYRSIDELEHGQTTIYAFGGGFDTSIRELTSTETDRFAVFQLVNPRMGAWWKTPYGDIDFDAGVSGDVAMVQSLARLDMPLAMDQSIVLTRGYYYATGVSANGHVRARRGIWNAEVESTAHQFWSYDHHDYRGNDDPKDLADTRILNTIAFGVKPTDADVRIEAFGTSNLRRGTGSGMIRDMKELEAGLVLRAGF